jgi:hypothetical protein
LAPSQRVKFTHILMPESLPDLLIFANIALLYPLAYFL